MLNWMSEYWYLCLLALIIGLLTAAWIWLRPRASEPEVEIDDISPPASTGRLEPNRPVIDVASPVDFAALAPAASITAAAAAQADLSAAATPPTPVDGAGERPAIAPAVGPADTLTLIKGVGPKLQTLLTSLGVTRFDQIAAWGDADIAEVDRFLGNFQGRIERDNWVDQAGLLASGDQEGFAAKYGALGSGQG